MEQKTSLVEFQNNAGEHLVHDTSLLEWAYEKIIGYFKGIVMWYSFRSHKGKSHYEFN